MIINRRIWKYRTAMKRYFNWRAIRQEPPRAKHSTSG